MNQKPFVLFMVAIGALLLLVLSTSPVMAQTDGDNYVPNWTNYQGYITDGSGAPLDGKVDLYFALYDAKTDGNKVWAQYHDDVEVNGGYFYVKLGGEAKPLGYKSYENGERHLEVYVSTTGCRPDCTFDTPGQYEKLPRQQIGAVAYAIKAHRAYSATWASKVHWDGVMGKPEMDNDHGYKYVITVAKEGGDYTSIYDAVESISDAAKDKQYLVWVAPGMYTETETIVTKPYVHIHGADPRATHIYNFSKNKTVVLQSYVTLRDISIHNYYNGERSYAIYANSNDYEVNDAKLHYVYAYAGSKASYPEYRSDYHYGFYGAGSIKVHANYLYAYGDYGKEYNYGAYLTDGASLYAKNSHFYGYYGKWAYGVYVWGGGDYNTTDTTYFDAYYVKSWAKYAETYNYGYYADNGGQAKVYHSSFYGYYGQGYGQYCYGVYNQSSKWTSHDTYGYAHNCTIENTGLYNWYGRAAINGDTYYGYVESMGASEQVCYGIYSGGQNGTRGWLDGYNTMGKAKNCYANYGLYNSGGGHAKTSGGHWYGEGGNMAVGIANKDANSEHYANQCNVWGTGGSNANGNFGYYNWNGGKAQVDFCTVHGDTYSMFTKDAGTSTYVGQTKFVGPWSWPNTGVFKCYGVYNANYDAVSCVYEAPQ
ncbi:MAG: hypothetical protein AAF702_26000 [Chloroflexota bacterium]